MKENGFSHRQGSGYISKAPMSDTDMTVFIDKLQTKFPWIYPCSNKIDGTEIGIQFDLKSLMETKKVEFENKIEKSETKSDDLNKTSRNSEKSINEQDTITISKAEYEKTKNDITHLSNIIKTTNLVLNEHPKLKEAFKKAKAETLQRKAEKEKGGLNDNKSENKISEHKKKSSKPKL